MDTLGLPVMITVTPADIQDRDAARDVFWRLRLTQPQITQVWADRDYAGELVDWARDRLCGRLLMVDQLLAGGLADIDHREPLQVTVIDLAARPLPRHQRGHRWSRSLTVAAADNARLASRTNCPTTACRFTSGSAAHTCPSDTAGMVLRGRRHCRLA